LEGVLDILRIELDLVMKLTGVPSLDGIGPKFIFPPGR